MRTLENFFKNGLTNNLTNRVFKTVYGTLYEETAIAGKWAGRSFHDLVMSRHMSPDEVRQAVEAQGGVLPEKFLGPTTIVHHMPEEGKGIFGKPVVEQSPNHANRRVTGRLLQRHNVRPLVVCHEVSPEEAKERVERVAGYSLQAIGRSGRIHPDNVPVITLDEGYRVDREMRWHVGGVDVSGAVINKWLFGEHMDKAHRESYGQAIWYLIQTSPAARAFIRTSLNKLHAIRGSDMDNQPVIEHMSSEVFERYTKGLRPIRMASTDICAAMHHVQSLYPEAKYVWFDGDLRWHYLDAKMDRVVWERDERINIAMLEDAVLEAADRGLMNQPLMPDLA